MTNKILINLSRLLFAGLIIYEMLNQLKILHRPLTFTWLGLVLTSSIVWLLLEIVSAYTKRKCMTPLAGWAMLIAAAGVYMDALGDIFLFYARFGWYDKVTHLLAAAAAAVIVLSVIKSLVDCQRIKLGIFGIGFFSWMTAGFLGIIYELEEYFEDYFAGRIAAGYTLRLGNSPDTANDLFLDLVGALVIIIIISINLYVSRRSHSVH